MHIVQCAQRSRENVRNLKDFTIDRSIQSVRDLALSLADPDTGDIPKTKSDYKRRQGICDLPITHSDLTKNILVCHAKIRLFEFIVELVTRHLSHKKWWSAQNSVTYTK